jgi:uncharacterized protein YjbJ (UPF0337 family)
LWLRAAITSFNILDTALHLLIVQPSAPSQRWARDGAKDIRIWFIGAILQKLKVREACALLRNVERSQRAENERKLSKGEVMKDSIKDKIEGAVHELKGTVKETVGRIVKNPDLEEEGVDEKVSGKVQKKVGDIEKVVEK